MKNNCALCGATKKTFREVDITKLTIFINKSRNIMETTIYVLNII